MKLLLASFPVLILCISRVQGHRSYSQLKVYYHSAPENALFSVSSLIVGDKEAMVVDAPFTNSAARSLISVIKKTTNLPVTKIFATHEHPDHFFGGTELLKAFPHASMIATPAVIKRIEEIVQSKVNEWRPIYGPKEIPEHPATPKPYSGTTITLRGNENEPIRLLQPLQGDIDDVSVLWIPSQRTLITGDLVYSGNQHVWLKEVRQKSDRDDWIESVRYLQSLNPRRVIGGHVPVGVKPRVTDMQSTIDYIEFFDNYVFGRGYSAQEISEIIKRQYPDRLAPLLLNITAETYGQKY